MVFHFSLYAIALHEDGQQSYNSTQIMLLQMKGQNLQLPRLDMLEYAVYFQHVLCPVCVQHFQKRQNYELMVLFYQQNKKNRFRRMLMRIAGDIVNQTNCYVLDY